MHAHELNGNRLLGVALGHGEGEMASLVVRAVVLFQSFERGSAYRGLLLFALGTFTRGTRAEGCIGIDSAAAARTTARQLGAVTGADDQIAQPLGLDDSPGGEQQLAVC